MSHRPTTTKKGTTLSNYVWHLKDHNVNYNLKWSVVARGSDYNPATGICRVCLLEKFFIMFKPEGASLNQRSEFFTHCRHYRKFLLCPPPPRKRKRRTPPNRWKWNLHHLHFYTYLFIYVYFYCLLTRNSFLSGNIVMDMFYVFPLFFSFCVAEDCHVIVIWNRLYNTWVHLAWCRDFN